MYVTVPAVPHLHNSLCLLVFGCFCLMFHPILSQVALLLRKLGDELDAELSSHAQQEQQTMLARRSVWEVRYEDFESLCNQVYESCRVSLTETGYMIACYTGHMIIWFCL